jgi:hypothetical protein
MFIIATFKTICWHSVPFAIMSGNTVTKGTENERYVKRTAYGMFKGLMLL